MKVLLLDNIKDTGKKGAVLTIADGLARNKLIPSGKVVEATPANIAKYKHLTDSTTTTQVHIPPKVLELFQNSILTLNCKANPSGSLYQAVHEKDILAAIHSIVPAHLRSSILLEHVSIPQPIKKTGKHTLVLANNSLQIQINPI